MTLPLNSDEVAIHLTFPLTDLFTLSSVKIETPHVDDEEAKAVTKSDRTIVVPDRVLVFGSMVPINSEHLDMCTVPNSSTFRAWDLNWKGSLNLFSPSSK